MTGWRLGYVVAKENVIKKMSEIAANVYTCPTSFAQKAAVSAFDTFDDVKKMIDTFKKRRDVMYSELKKIKGIQVNKSQGAFYMFPYLGEILRKSGMSTKDFSVNLIKEKGVVTIPGEVFPLDAGKEFVRLSFAVDENVIKEGVQRMSEFINQLMRS